MTIYTIGGGKKDVSSLEGTTLKKTEKKLHLGQQQQHPNNKKSQIQFFLGGVFWTHKFLKLIKLKYKGVDKFQLIGTLNWLFWSAGGPYISSLKALVKCKNLN